MEYNENDYNYDDYNNDDYPQPEGGGSIKGLKIAIGILLVVLAALSVLYWQQIRESKIEQKELEVERDTLTDRLSLLMTEMGDLRIDNDTMNKALTQQRFVADSLMSRLKQERNLNVSKIRQYERELGTLRTAMQGFVRQIDSLNRVNTKLAGENLNYRRQVASLEQRTAAAEETASELGDKVNRGSKIRIRDVALYAYDKKKTVSRARQVQRFVTEFVLAANDLAQPGEKTVYIRIITPDGDVMGSPDKGTFNFSGESMQYSASRTVDYQAEDLPVSVYYDVSSLYSGKYTVMVYLDGVMVGQSDVILR